MLIWVAASVWCSCVPTNGKKLQASDNISTSTSCFVLCYLFSTAWTLVETAVEEVTFLTGDGNWRCRCSGNSDSTVAGQLRGRQQLRHRFLDGFLLDDGLLEDSVERGPQRPLVRPERGSLVEDLHHGPGGPLLPQGLEDPGPLDLVAAPQVAHHSLLFGDDRLEAHAAGEVALHLDVVGRLEEKTKSRKRLK